MIKVLNSIDIAPILQAYTELEKNIQWTDYGHKGKQAGLQYKDGEEIWASAVGRSKGEELLYTKLNLYFKDTIFEDIINQYKLTRSRLMWIGPYACYSMHRDSTPRVHVPLITNPECYFVFKKGIIRHMPTGSEYLTQTTFSHTFMNCSAQYRLHLVGVVE